MDYFSLKCFVAVARAGSFSKAAGRLYRSQPAVSLQIKKLESELKQPLFDRHTKEVSLTPAGKSLYTHAQEIVERLEDMQRLTSDSGIEPEGDLTIATNLSLINNFLPPFVAHYQRSYPRVRISISNVTGRGIVERIMEGTADIGLGFLIKRNNSITETKIAESPFCLVFKKGSKKRGLDQILEGPCIHFEKGIDLRVYIEKHLERKLTTSLELPGIESILNFVHAGMGYSILPRFSLSGYWKNSLEIKDLSAMLPPVNITIYLRKRRSLSKAADKFLEVLRARL